MLCESILNQGGTVGKATTAAITTSRMVQQLQFCFAPPRLQSAKMVKECQGTTTTSDKRTAAALYGVHKSTDSRLLFTNHCLLPGVGVVTNHVY